MPKNRYEEVGVVVRYTRYDTDNIEMCVDMHSAFPNIHHADEEAQRLNAVVAENPRLNVMVKGKPLVEYFVKIVRYYPVESALKDE